MNLPQILIVSPQRPLAASGTAGRKKAGMLSSKGEMLPQFGAETAKIIQLVQRRQRPWLPFSDDSTNAAQDVCLRCENFQKWL
ncbi:MAG TPA: hypothetical protein VF499_06870 [Afipia sp.]